MEWPAHLPLEGGGGVSENMSNVSHAPRGVVNILIKLAIFFFKLVQLVALI